MTDGSDACHDCPERERLFREIDAIKGQRNELQAELGECRRVIQELRAELGRDS